MQKNCLSFSFNWTFVCFLDNLNKTTSVSKTEVDLFKSSRKHTDVQLKLKLNGKRPYSANSVKDLGIKIDENLN